MEEPSPSSSPPMSQNQNQSSSSAATSMTDLDVDSLAQCASYLSLQDLSNMAMTCKYLKKVAYSDSIWQRWFRECWPQQTPSTSASQTSGVRNAYLCRRTALLQFKFVDPFLANICTFSKPYDILLDENDIIFCEGSRIQVIPIDNGLTQRHLPDSLSGHTARITCMRLFPLNETSLYRSETQTKENVLVTSSSDHSIRLWWKGSCQRCFRGHTGPVSALSDKLLGNGTGKVLASGGEDGTVRLWSLNSSGKRGQQALKATFYGHEKPIKLMSVAGHKTSLLVTISKDSKVRVWDTTTSSSVRSRCCVGMTSIPGAPINMKCHEQLLYVAAGSSIVAIDLRTMQKVITAATGAKLYSFEAMPSKSLFCIGSNGRAMLYDIRRNLISEPIAELDGHTAPVTFLHMDPYKIVTGSTDDFYVNVWEANTGSLTNSLDCGCGAKTNIGCYAMAVNGCRIATASANNVYEGLICFRDFTNASLPAINREDDHLAKFWNAQSFSDTDSSENAYVVQSYQ